MWGLDEVGHARELVPPVGDTSTSDVEALAGPGSRNTARLSARSRPQVNSSPGVSGRGPEGRPLEEGCSRLQEPARGPGVRRGTEGRYGTDSHKCLRL